MKVIIKIKFIELNGLKVNKELFRKEPKLDGSAMVFLQNLGKKLTKDFLKPREVIASEPVYIIHHKKNSLSGIISFKIDVIDRVNPERLGKGIKIVILAFQKDMENIAKELEYYFLARKIVSKITARVK
jgi:hypothetical protein